MMKNKILRSLIRCTAILLFWLLAWQLASYLVGKELLLPSPRGVITRIGELLLTKEFYKITAVSVLRVLGGIILAVLLGTVLAVLTYVSKVADALLRPLVTVIKATPVASFIILALVWLDRSNLPIFISLLMVLPVVWTNLSEGLREVDKKLLEMADVYRVSFLSKVMHIYIPSVMPYFSSATKTSIGLAWKAGVAAEVIALPALSIGKKLFDSKAYLETTDLFAWTSVVIVLSLLLEIFFEALISSLTKRRAVYAEDK